MADEIQKNKGVSYSQYSTWVSCHRQWKLQYVDKLRNPERGIELVFGTAMHNCIQQWLPIHYSQPKKAKSMDLEESFKEFLIKEFKSAIIYEKDSTGQNTKTILFAPSTKEELQEYYEDGCGILNHVQKYGEDFFPTKDYELVGCEIALKKKLINELDFVGYVDIIICDTKLQHYYIIDLKTSRMGWYPAQKKDAKKINQLLLYKKFYSELLEVPLDHIYPLFIILKRKIQVHEDFVIRRLSKVEPSHGSVSMKKMETSWNTFLTECFDENGKYKAEQNDVPSPSESNCKYCYFKENAELCKDSWYLRVKRTRKVKE